MNKQKWIACALEKGFESFEIYQSRSREKKITWYEGRMDTYVVSKVLGTSFRGVYDGRMVNASTEDTSDDPMESIIADMISQAKMISAEDKARIRRPQEAKPLKERKTIVPAKTEDIFEVLKKIEQDILAADPRIFQVTYLICAEEETTVEITNSYGMDISESSSRYEIYASAAARENEEVRTGYEYTAFTDFASFDAGEFAALAAEKTTAMLGAVTPKSANVKVIIENEAMTSLFSAFAGMFSGEMIRKEISPLCRKLNEKIFSDLVTIVDDPRNPQACVQRCYDDEGCPTYAKTVVDKGVFRTILHSTKTADAMNAQSTGNGFRRSYETPVDVMGKNLCIMPGTSAADELCASMNDGIVITEFAGLHAGIDFVSADFSLQCAGFLVENGKRTKALTLMTAAGNFIELMNSVVAVGNDIEWKGRTTAAPSIQFASIAIAGE